MIIGCADMNGHTKRWTDGWMYIGTRGQKLERVSGRPDDGLQPQPLGYYCVRWGATAACAESAKWPQDAEVQATHEAYCDRLLARERARARGLGPAWVLLVWHWVPGWFTTLDTRSVRIRPQRHGKQGNQQLTDGCEWGDKRGAPQYRSPAGRRRPSGSERRSSAESGLRGQPVI